MDLIYNKLNFWIPNEDTDEVQDKIEDHPVDPYVTAMSYFYGHGVPQSYQNCKKYLKLAIRTNPIDPTIRKNKFKKLSKKEKRSKVQNKFQKFIQKQIMK